MAHVCPKSCGRLATAAILIAVGVVQLIAGLVLIKSKYVYLLSAPDFWTAVSNFSVGGLLGVSASVWKEIGKVSSKHATRRNILASLMFSCLLINATTAAILILGEGNALLSIQLEDSGLRSPSAVNSELLAYAYATSVCSPIICVVISCVYMSGICFRRKTKRNESSKTRKILDEDDPLAYNWVFKSKVGNQPKPDPEIIRRALSTKYLSSSTDDDSYCSSDSYHPHRSNSVPSVEGMEESLQTAIGRSRARSESNLFRSKQDRQEQSNGAEENTLPSRNENTVSFIDESSSVVIPSREVLLSLPGNFNRPFEKERNHSQLADRRINTVDMPTREKQMSIVNSNGRIKSDIPFNHSDLGNIEIQSNRSRHRTPLKQQFPTKFTQIPRPTLITADVHFDSKPLKSSHGYTNHSYSPEDSTLIYEDGRSSRDIFRKEDDCFPDRKVCRTSTTKSLMLGEMEERGNDHTSVQRTSKPLMPHSQEECSIIEDWNYDGKRDKENSSTRGTTLPKQYSKKSSLSSLRKQSEEIEKSLNTRIADDTFDSTQIDCLAGEVVPIQVSTLPKKLSSKLVPVNIPAVGSSVRRYSLKGAEKSLSRNMEENPRHGTSLVRASKFNGHGEPKLLSFRGGMKAKENRNRKTKNSVPRSNQHNTTPEPSTSNYTEYPSRRSCPTSPAHTSGYMSALEETLEPSERGDETLVISSSAVQMDQERHSSSTMPSQNTVCIEYNFGNSSGMVKETMTRIIEESPELKSKKELIDQLLSDPAFQKMVKQTLKETEI
ncbi:hypothetical protein JTE90_014916 [Oedothorax gibbosus]|uniref:Uncharacterized protein n=1 Tax=Oedothorax gibbosus TaxID=931172 RepID=A0AAV6VNX3_9ARAC|nr:hypothetical protein JTE90_014916 [Oedothorax gibbosus]